MLRCVKGVWVREGLKQFQNNSRVNVDEPGADTWGEGVLGHLALQTVSCILCTPAQSTWAQCSGVSPL